MNDATLQAALRIFRAAGRCALSAVPFDVAEELVEERLVDTDGTEEGWSLTEQGAALVGPVAAPLRPSRSMLAAKQAFTQATRAWEAKRSEGWTARDTYRAILSEHGRIENALYDELRATEKRCEVEAMELFAAMRAIFEQSKAQGWEKYLCRCLSR